PILDGATARRENLPSGAALLGKPFSVEDLARKVRELLDGPAGAARDAGTAPEAGSARAAGPPCALAPGSPPGGPSRAGTTSDAASLDVLRQSRMLDA